MKKKVLVTSILSIIMCMSLIIGATFALFTSESKVNIAVTSGKVDVKASVADLTTYSNGTATDVNGTFANGGTATVDGTSVVLDRLTPMDKVVLKIEITNSSNVAFKQRVSLGCAVAEQSLYDQLLIGLSNDGVAYTYYSNYKTAWTGGTVMEQGASETTALYLSIELPAWVGNEWQDKSCAVALAVEAVQGNAETTDDIVANEVVIVDSQEALTAAVESMASGGTVILGGGEWTNATIAFSDAKTINVRGYKVTGVLTVNAPNGTVNVYNDAGSVLVEAVAGESLHLFGTIVQMLVKQGRAVLETGASITEVKLQPVAGMSAKIEVAKDVAVGRMAVEAAAGSTAEVKIAETATVSNLAIEGEGETKLENAGTVGNVAVDENAAFDSTVTTASGLASAMNSGIAEVTLGADIGIVPEGSGTGLVPQFSVNKKVTLNLNGHTIYVDYAPEEYTYTPAMFAIVEGGDVTINGEGVITAEAGDSNSYGINVNGGKLTVNGGEWYGALTAIQVQKGELVVNDGFFDLAPTCKAAVPQYAKYVINCIDANFKNGTAKIAIKNGTFVNFDPSNNPEGAGTTYVAEGYGVFAQTQDNGEVWYRVAQCISSAEDLSTAIENGKNVILAASIELPEALEITSDVIIYGGAEGVGLSVSNGESARVINVNDNTEPVTLTLLNVAVVGPTSGGYTRGVSVYANTDVTIVVDNCSVSAYYYALNIASANENVNVVVKNTMLTGWCAFQTWSAGTKATFENCTLIGNNGFSLSDWNGFATIVINENTTDVELTFNNCRIEANQTTGNDQFLFSIRAAGAKVTMNNCTFFANGIEITDDTFRDYIEVYNPEALDFSLTVDGSCVSAIPDSLRFDGVTATVDTAVSASGYDGAVYADNGANVTINADVNGIEHRGGWAMAVWAYGEGTTVTINGGNFTQTIFGTDDQYDMIYASGGANIVITGGTFKSATPKWTLNCKDNSGSTITVTGGTFYQFDPSNAQVAPEGTTEIIVPEGYHVIQNGDWYTVVANEAA